MPTRALLRSFGTVVVVGGAVLDASPARAIGACVDDFFPASPVFRREPLPADARFLLAAQSGDAADATLTWDDGGAAVPVAASFVATNDAVASSFLVPDAPLVAGRTYTVTAFGRVQPYGVDDRVDVVGPATPSIDVSNGPRGDACCANTSVTVTATGGLDDDGALAQALRYDLVSEAGARSVFAAHAPGVGFALGTSAAGCIVSDPLARTGEDVILTVTAIDFAGNESVPTEPVTFRYASTDGVSPGGDTGLGDDEGDDEGGDDESGDDEDGDEESGDGDVPGSFAPSCAGAAPAAADGALGAVTVATLVLAARRRRRAALGPSTASDP